MNVPSDFRAASDTQLRTPDFCKKWVFDLHTTLESKYNGQTFWSSRVKYIPSLTIDPWMQTQVNQARGSAWRCEIGPNLTYAVSSIP